MSVQYTCDHCGVGFMGWPAKPRRFCSRTCCDVHRTRSAADRFSSKLQQVAACLLFTGGLFPDGYGQFWPGGSAKGVRAHRYAWEQAHGPIPPGKQVLHNCDAFYDPGDITYRRCVLDQHLWLGTNDDNMADMVAKGRSPLGQRNWQRKYPERRLRGERSPHAKLSEAAAAAIRVMYVPGKTRQVDLAREFHVNQGTISRVLLGKSWPN